MMATAIMPDKVKSDICSESNIGKDLLEEFVANRIKSSTINLWASMKKQRLLTWKMIGKQVKEKTGHKIVELKEDRKLFSRMLRVSKSTPDINLQKTVSKYELSVVPRSMFAAYGTMLHCNMKSRLMALLENLPLEAESVTNRKQNSSVKNKGETKDGEEGTHAAVKIPTVDTMPEVLSLQKPAYIRNCNQLADQFTSQILSTVKQMKTTWSLIVKMCTNL